jgi:hypothetical protein
MGAHSLHTKMLSLWRGQILAYWYWYCIAGSSSSSSLGPWAVVFGGSTDSTAASRWTRMISSQSTRRHRLLLESKDSQWWNPPPHPERILDGPLSKSLQKEEEYQPFHRRREQSDTNNNFRVSYVGEFQVLSSDPTLCSIPSSPVVVVLHAYCTGSGTVAVDTTTTNNNPNVVCDATPSYTSPDTGLVGIECVVDCTASDTATANCNDFFVFTRDNPDPAQVYFSCTGATASDVVGVWEWADTGDGTCTATTTTSVGTSTTATRLHSKLARLGLVCGGSSSSKPIIDDSLAECNTAISLDDTPGDDYTCFTGAPCQSATAACTIDYDTLRVFAQLDNAPSECITSLTGQTFVGRVDPEPIAGGGLAKARFQVTFGVLADEMVADSDPVPATDCSTTGNRLLTISCTNGGTIAWNQADSSATADCTTTSTGTALECTDSSGSINSLTMQVNYVRWIYALLWGCNRVWSHFFSASNPGMYVGSNSHHHGRIETHYGLVQRQHVARARTSFGPIGRLLHGGRRILCQ